MGAGKSADFFIVISGIIGYMLLVLVYCLPTETMKAHMLGGSIYSLLGILQEDSSESYITTYPNYWHGYLIFLKPFYFLFDFADMRMFNLTGVMCVMFLLIGILYSAKYQRFLLPLLVILCRKRHGSA